MDLLRHLRFFTAVAEERHYGRAAARLQMTQPPLSQGIRRLEDHLGVRLFDRDARGVRLTEGGRLLLPQSEDLLAAAVRLRETAQAAAPTRPTVRLGVPPDLGTRATRVAGRLRRELVDRDVAISVASSQSLVERVRAGDLDVAVVRHPSVLDGLQPGEVIRIRTWLLLPADPSPGGVAEGGGVVRLAELGGLPIALPPRRHHPAAHDLVVDTLRRHGHPGTTITAEHTEVGVAVATGHAAALTVDPPPPGAGVTALRVDGDLLPLRLRVVTPPQSRVRPGAAAATWAALTETALRDCADGG